MDTSLLPRSRIEPLHAQLLDHCRALNAFIILRLQDRIPPPQPDHMTGNPDERRFLATLQTLRERSHILDGLVVYLWQQLSKQHCRTVYDPEVDLSGNFNASSQEFPIIRQAFVS